MRTKPHRHALALSLGLLAGCLPARLQDVTHEQGTTSVCEREIVTMAGWPHRPDEALVVLEIHLSHPLPGIGEHQSFGEDTYKVLRVVQRSEVDLPLEGFIVPWDNEEYGLWGEARGLDPIAPGDATIVAYATPNMQGHMLLNSYSICRRAN